MSLLIEELKRIPWEKLEVCQGFATNVPDFLSKMVFAETEEAGQKAFNGLDNNVILQGGLYEAAEYLVPFLISGLIIGTPIGKWLCLDFITEIAGAYPLKTGVVNGITLTERCREAVRKGIPFYYHFLESADSRVRDCAAITLSWIETDYGRLSWYSQHLHNLSEIARRAIDERLEELVVQGKE